VGYHFWRIEVFIDSVPSGAVVHIDGRAIGRTPVTLDLPAGQHRIQLTHSHYEPENLILTVRHGDRLHRQVTLHEGTGSLSLLSNPRGAWVELDGVRQDGVTPMTVKVPTGPVTVRMGLDERRPMEKNVIVLPDQTLDVSLELNIDPHGSLTVSTSPVDARVRLPELGLAYEPGVRVPIGEQLIEVSRSGYETQRIRFDVRYGENHTSVTLTRAFGAIRVRTTPDGADVRLTYESEPGRKDTVPYEAGMRLPVGTIEVTARALGYRTAYRAVSLGEQGASVTLSLSPMNVRPGETFRDGLSSGGEGPLMVVVPAGRFVMGQPGGPPSVTPATVRTLSQPFAVSVNEVSVSEYRRYADATGVPIDARLTVPEEPVRYVSWPEAVAYTEWLSRETGSRYRLPTEAEWEYAARAGTDTAYFFGDDPAELCRYANLADLSARRIFRDWTVVDCDDGFERLAPVGSYEPNPFGIHDLLGNVAEWVQECDMPPYSRAPEDGSIVNRDQNCSTHGIRGGSWDGKPDALRVFQRNISRDRGDDRGIRLVKEL
jgi:formylglycine-generating enzyme required for sulfatase activity